MPLPSTTLCSVIGPEGGTLFCAVLGGTTYIVGWFGRIVLSGPTFDVTPGATVVGSGTLAGQGAGLLLIGFISFVRRLSRRGAGSSVRF